MFKLILAITFSILLFVFAGHKGWLFPIWPTSFPDQQLEITPVTIEQLGKLLKKKKFLESKEMLYPGAVDEETRVQLERIINILIESIIQDIESNPSKSIVLYYFKVTLPVLDYFDSSDMDMALHYMEEVLDVLDIKSSNELFNVWRYGLPIGWFHPH